MFKTMINKEEQEIIKGIVLDLINKMGFEAELSLKETFSAENEQGNLVVEIRSPESKFLIGKKGSTLIALQHIVKLLAKNKLGKSVSFIVDVDGYRQQHEDYIRRVANEVAQEVVLNGRAATLEPMNGYERRLVHLELEKNPEVKTESIGEGEERKVVISPAGN